MKLFILSAVLIGLAAAQAPVGGQRDSRCPVNEDTKKPTQMAHASDCGSFLKCNRGNAIVMKCPTGQHWNDVRKYCDTVQNANCQTGTAMQWQQPIQRPQPMPPHPMPPQRPVIEHPDYLNCPAVDQPGRIVYYPYHLNCSQFYQCVNGRAVL